MVPTGTDNKLHLMGMMTAAQQPEVARQLAGARVGLITLVTTSQRHRVLVLILEVKIVSQEQCK